MAECWVLFLCVSVTPEHSTLHSSEPGGNRWPRNWDMWGFKSWWSPWLTQTEGDMKCDNWLQSPVKMGQCILDQLGEQQLNWWGTENDVKPHAELQFLKAPRERNKNFNYRVLPEGEVILLLPAWRDWRRPEKSCRSAEHWWKAIPRRPMLPHISGSLLERMRHYLANKIMLICIIAR